MKGIYEESDFADANVPGADAPYRWKNILFALAAVMLVAGISGCASGGGCCSSGHEAMKGVAGKPAHGSYYTCPMHLTVRSADPKGKCPICGMNLIKKEGSAPQETRP